MRDYEKNMISEFSQYANVVENWPLYDSIVICQEFYGSEANVPGWYTTFNLFGDRERHSFFKNRTAGIAGEAYCNLQSGDSLDFAYLIDSVGIEITCPPSNDSELSDVDGDGENSASQDHILPQWWRADFPRHCGIQLKVQQDVRWEGPAMSAPSGVGAALDGMSFNQNAVSIFGEIPYMLSQTTQGVPLLSNRQPFPEPIGVPRTGTVELVLEIGPWARRILTNIYGPNQIYFNGGTPAFIPSRYIIRASLFGRRLVQQRAQYHR